MQRLPTRCCTTEHAYKLLHPCRPITCSMATPPTFTFGYRGGIVTGNDHPPSEVCNTMHSKHGQPFRTRAAVLQLGVDRRLMLTLPSQIDHDVEIVGWGQSLAPPSGASATPGAPSGASWVRM
jgi:hypothetical protein